VESKEDRMKPTITIALASMLALALVAAACGDETRIESPEEPVAGVTVSGEGRVSAPPDLAKLSLGVTVLAASVAQARDQAAASLEAMVQTLRDNGVDEDDIQTQQLSIYPEYDFQDGSQTLRGFRVSNTLDVKVREIDRTGEIVDDAVAAGGDTTTINSLTFTIDDPRGLQDQARAAAVEDARVKAETIARAAEVDVGDPISITESGVAPVPPIFAERDVALDQAAGATPIEPGELDVVVTLSVTFDLQ
jgi:uncharacterized protein YggE